MDLKYNKRYILGILLITIIFGVFSLISMSRLFNGEVKEEVKKTDYMLMLEEEYKDIEFNKSDDFSNFALISDEMVVEPIKYKNYLKPCFDFIIEGDGVVITKPLAKDFYDFNLKQGMKIVKINDQTLSGKSYFEILELLYSNILDEEKTFVTADNTSILYQYQVYNNKLEYNEESNVLYVYNLDEITIKAIHEIYLAHPDMKIDLSMATVSSFDGVKNFISLFYSGKELLFNKPEGVYGSTKGRKILEMTFILGENNDEGINFILTTILRLNSSIKVLKNINDTTNLNLNTTSFKALKVLKSANYTIYIKNYHVESLTNLPGDLM